MLYSCYFCNKQLPGKKIKRCSRCLLVTYCSRECQTASWKASHRHNCVIHPSVASPDDPNSPASKADMPKEFTPEWIELQVDRQLSKWLQLWRCCFQTFATRCLDLANHPPERVVTHCMQLVVTLVDLEDNPSKQYDIVNASVVLFSDVMAKHPGLKTNIDPTDLTRLRFVILLVNNDMVIRRLRLLQWNDPDIQRYHNLDKASSAALGGPDSDWEQVLTAAVSSMEPKDMEKMFGFRQRSADIKEVKNMITRDI